MDKFIIGVWQGKVADGEVDANFVRARSIIDEAAAAGVKILCLPEEFLVGRGPTEMHVECAIDLDDPRLIDLARYAAEKDVVTLIGLDERRGDLVANSQAVLDGGKVAGCYTKTMLTGGDWAMMGFYDDALPVFDTRGVRFGIIICHDSSFPEVAATLAWKGARIIFSPHFNAINRDRMDAHRIQVRNSHIGTATHYNVVVARANSVGYWSAGDVFGYGDSAIFGPNGEPIIEAGLFTEKLITADVAPYLDYCQWRNRSDLRATVIDQLHQAARDALAADEINGKPRRPKG